MLEEEAQLIRLHMRACSFQCSEKLSPSPLFGEETADPVPSKEHPSVPYIIPFYRSKARKGRQSQGDDPGRDGGLQLHFARSWALPELRFRLARQPHKTRSACLLLPRAPAFVLQLSSCQRSLGPAVLLISKDQSGGCLLQRQAPFTNRVFKLRFAQSSGLTCPLFSDKVCISRAGRDSHVATQQQPPPLLTGESGYLECGAPSPRLGGGRKDWVQERGTVGRLGGETRNLGGGKQVSFFRAPVLPAHARGWEGHMPVTFVCLETKSEGKGAGGECCFFLA